MKRLAACLLALAACAACDDESEDSPLDGSPADAAVDMASDAMATDAMSDAIGDDMAPPDTGPLVQPYDTLAEPVEIIVDGNGMAHIYAQSDLDLFLAAGYQQAIDRLFAVDIGRRQAVGRLSEVFGPEGRSGDLQARVLGFARIAQATLPRIHEAAPEEARFFAAFAAGLNRRVAEINAGDAPAPPEYAALGFAPEPFTPEELLAIGVRITFGFSSSLERDLLYSLLDRLAPGGAEVRVFEPIGDAFIMNIPDDTADIARGMPKQRRDAVPLALDPAQIEAGIQAVGTFVHRWRDDLDVGGGSNCWVINGEFTDNGRPILANDSHATYLDPNVMYPVHLNSADAGGSWDAIGMAFTGVPGVHVGHNRRVAWGATTHLADMLDLWDVRIRDGMAAIGGEDIPVTDVIETFAVRQPDGSFADERITVETLPGYGVIIPPAMLEGIPIGLAVNGSLMIGWPGFEPRLDALSYFDMARAADVDAWVDAVRLQSTGMQNWMGADAGGMRYQTSGLVPDRGPIEGRPTPNRIMDADDPATLWRRGFLDPDMLPAFDGSQPYMYSANNDPWGHTADDDPLDDPFYYGSFYAPGFRAGTIKRRLPEMLAEGPITREAMGAMQNDTFSPWAEEIVPLLTEAVAAIDGTPELAAFADRDDLRAAAERLQLWDRQMAMASSEASLFRMFAEYVTRRMLADDLGLIFEVVADASPVLVAKIGTLALRYDTASLLDMPRDAFLLTAFDEALATFTARGEPAWGDLHRADFETPDRGVHSLAAPGGTTALNVAESRCWAGDAFADACVTTQGAVYRFVTGFAEDGTPESDFACPKCLPEGDPDWVDGAFVRLPFRRAEVEAAGVETRTLMP